MVLGFLACLPSYSYSEEVFGSSQNAATAATWDMTNVLPQQAGLRVNSVFYRYTTIKNAADPLTVAVQNENALGDGFVFRSLDDWTGLPGNTLTRLIPTNIPLEALGDGSIETTGFGTVSEPTVIYNYQFDPCFDPQASPQCPGYIPPMPELSMPLIRDPLDDQFIQAELDRKADMRDDDQEERDRRQALAEKKEKLEVALGAVNSALMTGQAQAQAAQLLAMSTIPTSYFTDLPSTKYEETIQLQDNTMPNNRKGLRVGLAQQLLHQQMVDSQYENSGDTK